MALVQHSQSRLSRVASTYQQNRSGFSLIELLIAIAIIALLMSLAAFGYFQVIASRGKANTEQAITKLQSALDQQWKAALEQINAEPLPANVVTWAGDQLRAKVLWRKMRLAREFPTTLQEATTTLPSDGLNYMPKPVSSYMQYATVIGSLPAAERSSALLYLALKQSRKGVSTDPDALLTTRDLQDRASGGVTTKVIFDYWGSPIRFVRWPFPGNAPMAAAELTPSATAPPFRDPQDPEGKLSTAWASSANGTYFNNLFPGIHPPLALNQAYNLVPVIQSAGPDKNFDTGDDLMGYRLRLGAKGD